MSETKVPNCNQKQKNEGCRVDRCPGNKCTPDLKDVYCIHGSPGANDGNYICDGQDWKKLDDGQPIPPIEFLISVTNVQNPAPTGTYIPATNPIEEPSEYPEHSGGFPIPFGYLSDDIRSVQSILAKSNDFTREILKKGTRTAEYREVDPVDGKYGPRTELAIRTAIMLVTGRKKEFSTGEPDKIQLSKKDYDSILAEDFPTLLSNIKEKEKFDLAILNIKRQDPNIAMVESYKKDLFKTRKNRYKQLEKLVFERLVKGCK